MRQSPSVAGCRNPLGRYEDHCSLGSAERSARTPLPYAAARPATPLVVRGDHLAPFGDLLGYSRPRPKLEAWLPFGRLLAGAGTLARRANQGCLSCLMAPVYHPGEREQACLWPRLSLASWRQCCGLVEKGHIRREFIGPLSRFNQSRFSRRPRAFRQCRAGSLSSLPANGARSEVPVCTPWRALGCRGYPGHSRRQLHCVPNKG